jgi:hypothetical protein
MFRAGSLRLRSSIHRKHLPCFWFLDDWEHAVAAEAVVIPPPSVNIRFGLKPFEKYASGL